MDFNKDMFWKKKLQMDIQIEYNLPKPRWNIKYVFAITVYICIWLPLWA